MRRETSLDHIVIGLIKVNGVQGSSSLNVGPKLLVGCSSCSKENMAAGAVSGDYGAMPAICGWIFDNDGVDLPAWIGAPVSRFLRKEA
jgi:hypothetical protein